VAPKLQLAQPSNDPAAVQKQFRRTDVRGSMKVMERNEENGEENGSPCSISVMISG